MAGVVIPLRRAPAEDVRTPEQLVSAVAGGDHDALGVLFDRYRKDVLAFLHRLTRAGDAELDDMVQSTFLAVQNAARKFRGRSEVRTWILGVAANVGRSWCRAESRRRRAHQRLAGVEPPAGPTPPDEMLRRKEMVRRIAVAIEELPYRQRVAYVLCVIDGVPGAEAAEVLGIREGTLWRRIHDARRRLRRALDRNEEGRAR